MSVTVRLNLAATLASLLAVQWRAKVSAYTGELPVHPPVFPGEQPLEIPPLPVYVVSAVGFNPTDGPPFCECMSLNLDNASGRGMP